LSLLFRVDADFQVFVSRSDAEVRLSTGRVVARCTRLHAERIERYGREYLLGGPGRDQGE
jgi:hypothetical protein